MWAHYANLAKGFVVVLDDVGEFFRGDETGSLNVPKAVSYTAELSGMDFDPSSQDRLFFSKLADWSYEAEWRVVTALSSCRLEQSNGLYLKQIDKRHVRAVICGWRSAESERATIRESLSRINPDILFTTAFFDRGTVSINPPLF